MKVARGWKHQCSPSFESTLVNWVLRSQRPLTGCTVVIYQQHLLVSPTRNQEKLLLSCLRRSKWQKQHRSFQICPFRLCACVNEGDQKQVFQFLNAFYSRNKGHWERRERSWSKSIPRKPSCRPGRSSQSNTGRRSRAPLHWSGWSIRPAANRKRRRRFLNSDTCPLVANITPFLFLVHFNFCDFFNSLWLNLKKRPVTRWKLTVKPFLIIIFAWLSSGAPPCGHTCEVRGRLNNLQFKMLHFWCQLTYLFAYNSTILTK